MHVEKTEKPKDIDQFAVEAERERIEKLKNSKEYKQLKQKVLKNCDETLIIMGALQKKQNGLNKLLEKIEPVLMQGDPDIMGKAILIQQVSNQLIKPLTTK